MKNIKEVKKILKEESNKEVSVPNFKNMLNKINNQLEHINSNYFLVDTWPDTFSITYCNNQDAYLGLIVDGGKIVVGIFTHVPCEGYSFQEKFNLDELKDFTEKDKKDVIIGFLNMIPDFLENISRRNNYKKNQ